MKKTKILVVGCGDRSTIYCHNACEELDAFEVVACVDPYALHRNTFGDRFHVPQEMRFSDISEVLKLGKIADLLINGTMDQQHIATTLPFVDQGYDILLEKPITNNAADLLELQRRADEKGVRIMICHVLRYTKLYRKVKELILSGRIGTIMHIESKECVGLIHNNASYVRGKWNNESVCGSSYLLAKCCHDLDIICWLNMTAQPKYVQSFGSRMNLLPENVPEGAGTRCLLDCPLEPTCSHSAKAAHVDRDYYLYYAYQSVSKEASELTREERIESLKTDNPQGRCVYRIQSDLVDHQTVSIEFSNGSTALHTLVAGSMRPCRTLYVQGTEGEIELNTRDSIVKVRTFDRTALSFRTSYKEEVFDYSRDAEVAEKHSGGDIGLVRDLAAFLAGDETSFSLTPIRDSVNSHLCVFAAEASRKEHRIIDLDEEYRAK